MSDLKNIEMDFQNELEYYTIKLSRLNEFKRGECFWRPDIIVSIEDIKTAISNGIKEVNERYYSYNYLDDNLKTKEWHIGRIIYFINNPDRIDPIQIDNKCFGRCISGIPIIEDGNHRFMALLYLGMEDIKIDYCGRRDVLNYLMGITNEIPE